MKDAWKMYKRVLHDYPCTCSDALEALKEFAFALFALTLPLTFLVIYPFVVLYRKLKP